MPETVFEMLAVGDGDAPAIGTIDDRVISFDVLRATIERMAGQLRTLDIHRGDRVAIVLPNGPEMAITFLAVSSCATAAPLNPKYREDEYRFYLEDLGAKALVTIEGDAAVAHAAAPDGSILLAARWVDGELNLTESGNVLECGEVDFADPDDTALVLHTSGTTSRPKIVPLTHGNLATSAANIGRGLELSAADCCMNVMPLFHIHGLVAALLSSLAAGASVTCTPGFDGFKFFDWLDRVKPTWYTAVPTMHQMILARASRNADVIAASRLRFVRSSSASLPTVVLEEIDRVFGVPMIEAYGMTEASHQMASNPLPPGVRKPASVGPCTGIEMSIMTDDGTHLLSNQTGEVVIRGATVVTAYENNPDANADGFTDGWFRTGDQGYLDDDGYLFLTGRLKEIINRGGEKVSPLEIDGVLLRHPDIAQAVAFALPHDKLGEEVAVAVILEEGCDLSERDVRAFAGQHLADFKVPRKVVFVDEIPKGPTGKLQRIGLATQLGL